MYDWLVTASIAPLFFYPTKQEASCIFFKPKETNIFFLQWNY